MNETSAPILLGKLHQIMSELPFLEKDKTNTFQGYNYASEQAIKEAIHPLLVKYGVLFTFSSGYSIEVEDSGEGKLTKLSGTVTFYDTDTGESIEVAAIGQGYDKQDKGAYKAITGALKYALTSTFLIPTGDDPEDAWSEDQGRSREAAAIAAINETAFKAGTEMAQGQSAPPQAHVPPPEMVAAAEMLADSIPGGARVEHDIGGLPLEDPDPFPEPPASAPELPPVPPTQSPGDWHPSQSQTKRLWAIFKGTGWSYGQLGEFLDGCSIPANDQIYVRCGSIPTKALYDQICDHLEANRK